MSREALCVGGPLHGQRVDSRFPKGFVLVDKPHETVWVYDADASEGVLRYISRSEDLLDWQRLMWTANRPNYDVRALDVGEITEEVGR